jgi:hypothetical protein
MRFIYQKSPKSIGGFEIDLNEHYSFSNKVTELPLEDGSIVSDHVVALPDEILIQGFIGKTKMVALDGSDDFYSDDPMGRIQQAYFELKRLKESRQLLTIEMGLEPFRNMIITEFDIGRDASAGADLKFNMTFKRVKIVKSETTTITASTYNGPAGDQMSGTVNAGMLGSTKTDPDSDTARKEWRDAVRLGWANNQDYLDKWGVPYPQ